MVNKDVYIYYLFICCNYTGDNRGNFAFCQTQ